MAATVKDWSHGYLDPIRLAVLAIIQDGLAARAVFVHRAAQPLRRLAIGFLALQNRAELFPAQFFERISTHRAEGGVDPLHQAVRAGHYQTIRGNLLRAIAEQSQNSALSPGEGPKSPGRSVASVTAAPTSANSTTHSLSSSWNSSTNSNCSRSCGNMAPDT